jgi:hypothetical protein
LSSSDRFDDNPSLETPNVGFRVANIPTGFIPEPRTGVLAALGFVGLVAWGRRRRER